MDIKYYKEADNKLRKAKKVLQVKKNKLKRAFKEQEIKGRKEDLTQKKAIL